MFKSSSLTVALLLLAAPHAFSGDPVTDTQNDLTDRARRKQLLDQSGSQAQSLNKQVEALAGSPEKADELYKLAAEIFGDLAAKTGGDPAKMLELLEKARKDPKSFAGKLTPEQQAKLRALSPKAAPQP